MALPRQIVAIGGGGFLMDDTSARQERFLLSLLRESTRPRVLYLGTAGGDSAPAQVKFFRLFGELGAQAATQPFFPYEMKRDYERAVRDADLVYVGGGNTPAMLAVWREFGFDRALRAAYDDGTVLAGISAGGNCWFEHYVTDSVPGGGVRPGLGWLGGTFCPHLDSEPWRQSLLDGRPGMAAGAGEHVMLHYVDEAPREAVHSAGPGTAVTCVRRVAAGDPLLAWPPRALAAA